MRRNKGTVFIEHIKKHLAENEVVICKICGKTVEEIYEEYKQNLTYHWRLKH